MPRSLDPKELTALDVQDVARLLCVTDRSVRNYINDNNLPAHGDGRGRSFVWAEVLEWYIAYRIGMAGSRGKFADQKPAKGAKNPVEMALEQQSEDLRKTTAEADRLELKLAQERGEVVAVADVEKSIGSVAGALKNAILAMPAKMVTRLYGVKDRNAIRAILDREARDLCAQLATIGEDSVPPPRVASDDV